VGKNGAGSGLDNAREMFGRFGPSVGAVAVLLILAVAGLSRVGCVNQHTPPGHEGYVRSKPIAGAGKFVGIQEGPTSTGWVWRQEVVNIDMRPKTYSEHNAILTAEQLKLSFRAHARIRLRKGSVQQVVEQFGGANWYEANVRQQFAAAVREEVQSLKSFEVKSQVGEISKHVMTKMNEQYKDTPVEFRSVDIGDIQYPEVVVQSVIRKFVTNQDNDRKEIELRIAQKQIDIGIAEAMGTRDAQRIIRTTLDPMYLQFEALEAIEQLAESTNTTFLIMPFSKKGNAPIIVSIDK
jgi:hypothetical protein